jgi:hypothetical protein
MRSKLAITLTICATLLCMLAVSVEAQRGRRARRVRGQRAAPAQQAAPQSAAIAEALGDLRWGMEPRQVHEYFATKIRERYRERLTKAPGTIEEDRIRAEQDNAIRALRESYVRFTGDRTGWDLSYLRGEFTHGNRESMLVYRDENSQNFYFFIGGRLWKWYKAFDASVFQGRSFDQFAEAIQGRFGRAAERSGRLIENGPEQQWLEWQDRTTRLRAVDQTRFYGFYCLVFEDKETLDRLATLRTNTIAEPGSQAHALVESITVPNAEGDNDDHADIADRISGSNRRPQNAPQQPAAQQTGNQAQPARPGNTPQQGGQQPRQGGTRLSIDDL